MRQFERFPNLVTMFFTRAREGVDKPFLWRKVENAWRPISWGETARQVAAACRSSSRPAVAEGGGAAVSWGGGFGGITVG